MFKLKPGNVFQKLNKMDKKQAYTWGAIVVVCFIALITLASFLGDADDASFDGFNTRGYDLAQMPFINDEAEEYLLASKYPDMKNNGSTMLYSQADKEARQEADAEAAAEAGSDSEESSSSDSSSSSTGGYSGRGYTGGGRSGGTGTPTQVGQLGSASMGHAGGSGMSGTFGAPRGDFSPYKSQEKGSEIQTQLKNTDARRALSQFAQTSRAAAGLKDNKNANAKRALMGGSIRGSEAFTDSGVDLSKTAGLELDTNAPVSSADLSNLDKAVSDAANKAKDDKNDDEDDFRESLADRLMEQLLSGLVDIGLNAMGNLFDQGVDSLMGSFSANKAGTQVAKTDAGTVLGSNIEDLDPEQRNMLATACGIDPKALDGKTGSARDFYRESKGKPSLSAPPSPHSEKYELSSIPAGGRPGEDYTLDLQVGSTTKKVQLSSGLTVDMTEPDFKSSRMVVYDTKQYQADLKQYNKGYNANLNEDINEFAKETKTSYYPNSNSYYADNFRDTRDAAFNSRQRNTNRRKISRGDSSPKENKSPAWYERYGSEYGNADKYDQSIVSGCKGSASPRTCLDGAKKK